MSLWASTSTPSINQPIILLLRDSTPQAQTTVVKDYQHRYLSTFSRPQGPLQPGQTHHPVVAPTPRYQTVLSRAMSSDDAYMAFLNKANSDLNDARTQQAQSPAARTETVDVGVQVPGPLKSVDAYYVSETDEPFEPVTLKWEGANKGIWPSPSQLSKLISPETDLSSSIETLSPSAFDPKNQYPSALRAVRAAVTQASGGGEPGISESDVEIKVYRVEVGSSRVQYYILSLDAEGGTIVGLRAKAIES